MGLMLASAVRPSFPPTIYVADDFSFSAPFCGTTAHILRLLSTHHILRELTPDVFANNRISALMDSGKKVEELVGFGR